MLAADLIQAAFQRAAQAEAAAATKDEKDKTKIAERESKLRQQLARREAATKAREARREAARESWRALQTQISAGQSLLSAERAEATALRYGQTTGA